MEFIIHEVELAWALARAADPYLSPLERHDVYIAIAVGDTFSAIRSSATTLVRADSGLPADLKAAIARWLAAYAENEDEPSLRMLFARVRTYPPA